MRNMSEASINDATVVSISEGVLSREAGGDTVLLSLEQERYFSLEGAANRMWELVSESKTTTIGSVLAAMQEEFDVDPEVLQADAFRVFRLLAEQGLVRLG